MEKHALHIWPRTTFMLIALPNIDGSFTATFFFPLEGERSFENLTTVTEVISFFRTEFPDVVPLMPSLVEEFFTNPIGSMMTIKCSPWYVHNKVAILGDASHAIVPFFGQGMNCAFESCTVLNEILEEWENRKGRTVMAGDWEAVFQKFGAARKHNTDAIADLAVENFVEMRDLVARPDFQLKKKIEQALQARWPERFTPKYSMVTFSRLPYSVALEKGLLQDRILNELAEGITGTDDLDWPKADILIRKSLER
jgi:kynurenine 3-monooxygenase